jgi:hypothetical protein
MSLTTYWWAMKLISIYQGLWTSKISATDQPQSPKNFVRDYFTVPKPQYDLELSARTSLKMSGKGL